MARLICADMGWLQFQVATTNDRKREHATTNAPFVVGATNPPADISAYLIKTKHPCPTSKTPIHHEQNTRTSSATWVWGPTPGNSTLTAFEQ